MAHSTRKSTRSTSNPTLSTPEEIKGDIRGTDGKAPVNNNKETAGMVPAADKFESMLTGLASSITEVQNTLASLLIKANENASSIQNLNISTIKADKDIHDNLDDYIQNNQELKQDINLVNKRVEVLEGEVAELKAIRRQEVESKRQLTLVIKGISDTKNEKLHITMVKLLDNMGTS